MTAGTFIEFDERVEMRDWRKTSRWAAGLVRDLVRDSENLEAEVISELWRARVRKGAPLEPELLMTVAVRVVNKSKRRRWAGSGFGASGRVYEQSYSWWDWESEEFLSGLAEPEVEALAVEEGRRFAQVIMSLEPDERHVLMRWLQGAATRIPRVRLAAVKALVQLLGMAEAEQLLVAACGVDATRALLAKAVPDGSV